VKIRIENIRPAEQPFRGAFFIEKPAKISKKAKKSLILL